MVGTCRFEERSDVAIVTPTGEVDAGTADAFRHAAQQAREGDARLVVVDLGETTFMDSTGFGIIAGLLRDCRERGARLVVANVSGVTGKALRLLGMDRTIEVVDAPDLLAWLEAEATVD